MVCGIVSLMGIELNCHCGVCGIDMMIEGVENPVVCYGLMSAFASDHQHGEGQLKMYHDAQIAVEEYRHSHPYGGDAEDE